MSQDNEIGGAVCEEILSRRTGITVSDLSRKLDVREEKILKVLDKLCGIGIVAKFGDKYISAESVQHAEQTQEAQPAYVPIKSQAVAMATDGGTSKSLVTCKEKQVMQYSVDEREIVKTEDAIQKILAVFTNPGDSMKAHLVAQKSGLGNNKSAVNRYLYFLAEQGVLSRNGTEWTLVTIVKGDEMKVMAAALAKKPQGKKKDSSSSLGSNEDCDCPNRGPGCQHYYLTQNVHNHQYNIQVGDKNVLNFGVEGPRRSDT